MTLTEAFRALNKAGQLMHEDMPCEDLASYVVRVLGGNRVPDVTDAAQRGRLLAILRSLSGEPTLASVRHRDSWWLMAWDEELESLEAWQPRMPYCETGPTEGDAIAQGFLTLAQLAIGEAA